jgi:signal transduction histidine kinase
VTTTKGGGRFSLTAGVSVDPSHELTIPTQATSLDGAQHHSGPVARWRTPSLYVLTSLFLTAVVVGFVWYDLREAYRDTLAYWDVRMSSSADEGVSFASLWLNERRTDTEAIAENGLSARVLSTEANRSDRKETRQGVERAIERMARINGFVGGAVTDMEYRIAAQTGVPEEAMTGVQEACRRAERAGDFSVLVSGARLAHVWLYLAYPVFAVGEASPPGRASPREIGAVVMVAEPWKAAFPLLSAEGVSKGATETLIAWKDADKAVVFSPSLAIKGVESVFRRPLSDRTFESRAAREGNVLFGEFTDYRGVRVLGAARPIGSTGVSLLRKVDKDGALSEFHRRAVFESLAGALSILLLGSLIAALHRHVASRELLRSLDQLHALAGRLQSVREEERKRVAREVHDQLGQALTALKLDLGSLLCEIPGAAQHSSKRASSILKLVDETIQAVRRISTELRPGILDDLGLVATVEWAGGDFEARTGTKCRLDLPQDEVTIDSERATAVFRILQEALTNVVRYAEASEVKVRLARENGDLSLEIHDNGRGIDEDKISSADSLGILGMRERARLLGGELTVRGVPRKGTTVRVRIPEGSSANRA